MWFHRTDAENAASWQKFLEALYETGLTPENGLALLVLDGSAGLRNAYENVYWQVPLQRCVFHKLRNIAQALRIPAELDRQAIFITAGKPPGQAYSSN